MREEDESGKPKIYWLAYKSQLLRAAPLHVRPEIGKSTTNMMGNFEDAKAVIRSLKSRGVTRFADLTIQNKRNIYDIDTDEEVLDDVDSDLEPPAQRRRLLDPNFSRTSPAPSLAYSPSVAPDAAKLDLDEAPPPDGSLGLEPNQKAELPALPPPAGSLGLMPGQDAGVPAAPPGLEETAAQPGLDEPGPLDFLPL